MSTYADKNPEKQSTPAAKPKYRQHTPAVEFTDNRPEAILQRKLQEMANNSPQAKQAAEWQATANASPQAAQLRAIQTMANNSPQAKHAAEWQAMANNHAMQQHPIQKKPNHTGLPDTLKTGIENLSGYAMDDVKVHYNSHKPAQLQAHAYAQGTNIHLAPGQEKHLPHEAWHVIQQKQGRVQPTLQMKGGVNINDNAGLEKEADVMGVKTLSKVQKAKQFLKSNYLKDNHVGQKKAIIQLMFRRIAPNMAPRPTQLIPWSHINPRLIIGEGQDKIRIAAKLSRIKNYDQFYFEISNHWGPLVADLEKLKKEKKITPMEYWARTVQLNREWIRYMVRYGVGLVDMGWDTLSHRSPYYKAEMEEAKETGASINSVDPQIKEMAQKGAISKRPATDEKVEKRIEELRFNK